MSSLLGEFRMANTRQHGKRLVAIKRLFSSDREEFDREVKVLVTLGAGNKGHPHLIRLLATYLHQQKYHLMFPWADANLRKYWEDRPFPKFDTATVLWSLKQMTGIAEALVRIHKCPTIPIPADYEVRVQDDAELRVQQGEEKFGRHGDIKSENILWFKQSSEVEDENGVLQIADFGLGRFHGRESRSQVPPDTVFATQTYEPPELKLRQPVSRAYDIWSLGCLYLEFITWLLKGSAQIDSFSDFRGKTSSIDGIYVNDDCFFVIIRDDKGVPTAAKVREEVIEWVNMLHEHEKCSDLVHDLLDLIVTHLLVVNSKDRIKADRLNRQLKTCLSKAKDDAEYLIKPAPRPRNPRRGEQSNPAATVEIIFTVDPPNESNAPTKAQPQPRMDLGLRKTITPGSTPRHVTWPPDTSANG